MDGGPPLVAKITNEDFTDLTRLVIQYEDDVKGGD